MIIKYEIYSIERFNRKILVLKEEQKSNYIKLNKLKEEYNKLELGKILDIPKDMEDKLHERDIKIIYGMDWLKKNNYSEEENLILIKNNPFLPYSLIMEKDDLIKLEKENLEIFTYYPIPIIRRDSLNLKSNKNSSELYNLEEVTFYLAFNNKLINEKELKKLLKEKKNQINNLMENINIKEKDIEFYENNKNQIEYSTLDKNNYENLQKQLVLKEEELNLKDSILNSTRDAISEINRIIEKTNKSIREGETEQYKLKMELEDFQTLSKKYEIYVNNKENLEKNKLILEDFNNKKSIINNEKENLENSLSNFLEDLTHLKSKLNETEKNLTKYFQYNNGHIIEKDIEDLEARYDSLTKELSSDIQLLEDNLKDANERLKNKEEDLINKQDEYNIKEEQYREVAYDRFKEQEIKRELKTVKESSNNINEDINKLNIIYAKLESKIENLYTKIKDDFGKYQPKERENIISIDFKNRIFENKHKLEEVILQKDKTFKIINIIESNLSNLEEFKDFNIMEKINIDVAVEDFNKFRGELQRDLRHSKEEEGKKSLLLIEEINKVSRKPEFFEDDFFRKSLETIEKSVDKPEIVIENLSITLDAHSALMEKLQADIDLITKEKENVCQSIYEYVLEVHTNIGKIDNNSSIKIRDKYVKMLNIKLPQWESNSDIYKLRVNDYIETLTNKALLRLKNNENIEDLISKSINTCELYNEVVSISNIDVKLYKIEEDKQVQISWNDVSQNSGGEGFLSAFVILSSLLSYMKRDETDIFSNNEDGKVIIMDNPFAQTSAEHLLKPLMDIAKKSNTQLICFSGLGGDSIYNRFDNIYVLNLISSKLKSGLKYLRSEKVKGEEFTENLIGSRFILEEVSVDQMDLF
ncbi:hypothetical protein CLOACE_01350 [Clostridium acetireducens DSM 10703]|uniref:Uncharacterized protein n=1 Tax=Clostridium acetireducens DSM 10703 TaxID=1121290 RepID=A0A1E8F2B4_9CLOT|nr:hypothetical protein [Clostridium acetireducens]OFI07787.1 hypothetical protein CLOACE_01350 [Clostridium acetireducens DSM 10703]